jgi:hypothetical protein
MKSRIPFGLLMAAILVGSLTAVPARADTKCDAAKFVADVTIPDGTAIEPGAIFAKIWRLKNIGVCTWNNDYTLVFSKGTRMGSTTSVKLSRTTGPGQTVDVSVTLVAPTVAGTYTGYWMLQDAAGDQFGIGDRHRNPFWVKIRVLSQAQSGVGYDFVAGMCSAQWIYDGGPIPCPMNTNKLQFGHVERLDNPTLESGRIAGAPSLLTVPQQKYNGLIRGMFTVDDILRGDHFQATVGCQFGATNCYVTYALEYERGGDFFTLWKWKEAYDGRTAPVDVDLSRLANLRNIRLVLSVFASGPAEPDQAIWVAPRIVRGAVGPVPTLAFPPTSIVPTGAPTGTPLPPPSAACDRVQFIADVTVPDGTVFRPGEPFTKTWRLKNIGMCTWTTAYALVFETGDQMGGPALVKLPAMVDTGQTVDLSLPLTAPGTAGSYRGYWRLKNAYDVHFGMGATAMDPWWVNIRVAGTPVTPTRTATPTRTGTAARTPTTTRTAAVTPTGSPAPSSTPTAAVTPTASKTPTSSPTVTASPAVRPGWNTWRNDPYAFSFMFPPGSTVASQSATGGKVYLPITPGTNLKQKWVEVNVAEGVSPCKSPGTHPTDTSANVTFNGIQFLKETWGEGAMSHRADNTAYSTAKGNACITLTFVLWSVVPEVLETPPPLFDRAAEAAVFTQIMGTYTNQ